jgi:hypothetical protein
LATLALLRQYAEPARAEPEYLTMLARGLQRPLPLVEEMALAALGLEIAWGRLRDAGIAYPYAMILGELASQHPSLRAYYNEGGMTTGAALAQAAQDDGTVYLEEVAAQEEAGDREHATDPDPPAAAIPPPIPPAALAQMRTRRARPTPVARRPYDQPRAPRLTTPADLHITVPDAADANGMRMFSAVTRDVSETGLFFLTEERLALGVTVGLCIELSALGRWGVNEYVLDGRVVRATVDGLAIHFDNPPDGFRQHVRAMLGEEED